MADDELQNDTSTTEGASAAAADTTSDPPAKKAAAKRAAAKKAPAKKAAAKKTAAKKTAAADAADAPDAAPDVPAEPAAEPAEKPAKKAAAKKTAAKKTAAKKTTAKKTASAKADAAPEPTADGADVSAEPAAADSGTMPLFQVPDPTAAKAPAKRSRSRSRAVEAPPVEPVDPEADEDEESADAPVEAESAEVVPEPTDDESDDTTDTDDTTDDTDDSDDDSDEDGTDTGPRRRRRRGGRRRRRSGDGGGAAAGDQGDGAEGSDAPAESAPGTQPRQPRQPRQPKAPADAADAADGDGDGDGDNDGGGEGSSTTRRRRKRRREGEDGSGNDDPSNTTTRVRRTRSPEDEITAIAGSTRLEAKKQRRRDGREAGRRRAPIVSEAEFLARRESVERVMVVRQRDELTQIAVLEDKVLVEHYVARESQTSLIGNVYLGRVQNVLPSMEAAFIDIGKGRNAVLYAGEVNWSQLGHKDGQPRKIESVLSSGQTILVQVSKDPVGHKGARLTSQISLAGRFLVYVPDGTTSGISRKLPDTERNRLKTLLKEVVPSTAGVIVRTAAEGASEDELTQDVERLKARWEEIEGKAKSKGGNPQLLHGEPDLTLKVVRDLFTEDFAKLVIQGDDAWSLVRDYVSGMAPDLEERLEKYDAPEHNGVDLFAAYRIDEQIAKALDRKVFLPSGGSLVIDRTEAMTVVDVNTGKFTGSGGNLEETVTKNNLEAAEEVVRQLRLRDIGGIIVVDFIDMVLEANRDLVLRRMVECLGRDRTRHQVAEVTSLGLVQMTRKRIGTGLLEAFSENCTHCQGRGVVIHDMPVAPKGGQQDDDSERRASGGRRRGGGSGGAGGGSNGGGGSTNGGGGGRGRNGGDDAPASAPSAPAAHKPTPAEFAAMAKAEVHREAVAAAEAAASASSEPVEPVEPLEPAAPKVVTRQRRGVSRTVAPEAPEAAEAAEAAVEAPAEAPAAAPVEPAAPKVVTRQRRGVSRTVAPDPAQAEAVEAPVETPVAAPVETPAEPVAEAPVEPAAPRVVTRQRRGVSRTVATAAPAAELTPVEVVPAAEVAPVAAAATSAPEPPKVVTRTRGGASSRAVSPPAEGADGAEAASEEQDSDDPAESGLHVPIKRRGRKR